MERKQYVCPKCGCTEYESDQFQATGGNFAKMFDIQNKRLLKKGPIINVGVAEKNFCHPNI